MIAGGGVGLCGPNNDNDTTTTTTTITITTTTTTTTSNKHNNNNDNNTTKAMSHTYADDLSVHPDFQGRGVAKAGSK